MMRLAAVVRSLATSRLLLHLVAVRAVLGARQRRWLDENDAEPDGPEAGDQSQAEGATHGDRIHQVVVKRIPTARRQRSTSGRIRLGVQGFISDTRFAGAGGQISQFESTSARSGCFSAWAASAIRKSVQRTRAPIFTSR